MQMMGQVEAAERLGDRRADREADDDGERAVLQLGAGGGVVGALMDHAAAEVAEDRAEEDRRPRHREPWASAGAREARHRAGKSELQGGREQAEHGRAAVVAEERAHLGVLLEDRLAAGAVGVGVFGRMHAGFPRAL